VDPRDLDVSTRPDIKGKSREDITIRPRRNSSETLAKAAAAVEGDSPGSAERENASQKFSKHVAQPNSFASKFGHYNQQMAEGAGMSGEDDSQRTSTGSFMDDSVHNGEKDWQAHMLEHGGRSPRMSQDGSQLPPSRSMSSLYAVDSAMCDTSHSSNSALATVEEEAAPRKLKLQGVPSSAEPKHEMEMAVRRGKNLYTGDAKNQPASPSSDVPPLAVQ